MAIHVGDRYKFPVNEYQGTGKQLVYTATLEVIRFNSAGAVLLQEVQEGARKNKRYWLSQPTVDFLEKI